MSLLVGLVPTAIAAYVCLLGPGQAWWRGDASGVPRLFARVAASAAWTTLLGLVLAALEVFSLPRLAVLNGVVTLIGYVLVGRVRHEGEAPGGGRATGVIVFLATLCLYWPPYETHFAASDSTAYLSAGAHLARSHKLWKQDPLVSELTPMLRRLLFFSVLGSPAKPPYARMPGGLAIDTPDSDVVRPTFFPAPVVWSALFADALGARFGGGYAPLFGALAVWATYLFARRRLGLVAASFATVLVALNAACYWAGRFALAEPLAWFFLWAGLVALDAYEEDGFAADARLAGALLGATAVVRIEYAAFLSAVLIGRRLLQATLWSRPLTAGFALAFAAGVAAAVLQIRLLPGAYASPIADAAWGLEYRLAVALATHPWTGAALAVAALACVALVVRALGVYRAVLVAALATFAAAYVQTVPYDQLGRSLRWLTAYLGAFALLAAAAGGWLLWRERHGSGGDGFFVLLVVMIGGLLVYHPHVQPLMPWASRRFVPVVIPAVAIAATIAVARLSARTTIGGLAAAAALAASVLAPARDLWATPFYAGTYDRLRAFKEKLPTDGTLLIDNRLIPFVIATPLWLYFDLDSLPADPTTTNSRPLVTAAVYALRERGPVYLLKPSAAPAEPIPFVATERVFDDVIEVRLPEQTDARPPHKLEDYGELVSLFALSPLRGPFRP